MKHWEKPVESQPTSKSSPWVWQPPYIQARSVDIEMNAYALLTYTLRKDIAGAVMIVKWIISQRNSDGGFSSTQVGN